MKRNIVKLDEAKLKQVIAESVRRVLKERSFKPQGTWKGLNSIYGSKANDKYQTPE